MAYLANYFKRQDLSDIDIVFRLNQVEQQVQPGISEDDASPPMKRGRRETVDEAVDAADKHSLQLSRFPGHKIVLFSVEYFKAQVNEQATCDFTRRRLMAVCGCSTAHTELMPRQQL